MCLGKWENIVGDKLNISRIGRISTCSVCLVFALNGLLPNDWANAQQTVGEQLVGIPEIIVTSQRTEQTSQTVPIAVTAVDASALDRLQIDNFSDLQFNIPNVSFSKDNFTGSNFQIRGIGNTLVAATSDNGVSIHINDVAVNSARLFETEYYDLERIEILRGPQGTLFGRNATSGVVNMITKRPVMDEFSSKAEFEYGNYDTTRVEAAVNLPLGEKVAVRLAGNWIKRDGYTRNIFNDTRIDGRDSYSFRGTIRIEPSDNTVIDLMVSWFEENSSRSRSQKQLCHRDPVGSFGCLPDSLAFETVNANATLPGIVTSSLALGPYALTQFPEDVNTSQFNPPDLREVSQDFDPVYEADELLVTLNIEHEFNDNFILSIVAGFQNTMEFSQGDYNHDSTFDSVIPQAVFDDFPIVANTMFPGGLFPISAIDETGSGVIGGHVASFSTQLGMYDQSDANAEQWSGEIRLTSSFDGPLNFMLGFFYLDYTFTSNYYIVSSALDYFSLLTVPNACGPICDGLTQSTSFFNNVADPYELKSWAVFAEAYWDIGDELRLTGGIRYTDDKKTVTDRQFPLFTGLVVPLGTQDIYLGEEITQERSWGEFTGRVVLEWSPDLSATDASLFYLSYSRGYKGGGLNPPINPLLFPDSQDFDPEFIDAFELGAKLNFADNRAQANITAFYYDYQGLQISKIINRTSINENIDAKLWGMEGEFLLAPNQNWLFNLSVSYLDTSVGEASSIDPRDPTNGDPNAVLIKDVTNASNCVIETNGAPDPTGGNPFSSCEALQAALNSPGSPYVVSGGVEADLKGNKLQQTPDFTINIGAQYTHFFGNGMSLSMRADYYYQSNMFGRMFNKAIDRIDNWDQLNAQIKLESADKGWFLTAYIKNIMNDDNITGMFVTDPATGLFTNVFVLEPRRFGAIIGANF